MSVNPIHGLYLELERAALARGDREQAAVYRRAIGIHRASRSLKRRGGDRRPVLGGSGAVTARRLQSEAS